MHTERQTDYRPWMFPACCLLFWIELATRRTERQQPSSHECCGYGLGEEDPQVSTSTGAFQIGSNTQLLKIPLDSSQIIETCGRIAIKDGKGTAVVFIDHIGSQGLTAL